MYISFLVRLWREARPQSLERAAEWQGEVEHIQSGRCSAFDSLDELLDFLRWQVVGMESGQPADE